MVEFGAGPPLIVIPGIQGHWQWMTPALRALARRHRVLTFSLSEAGHDPSSLFDEWLGLVDALIARASSPRVPIVGVSFGGLIAVHAAARRADRVGALALVSTPAPRARLDAHARRCLAHPVLTLPLFAAGAVVHLLPEILAARATWAGRAAFASRYIRWPVTRPINPVRMAEWVHAWLAADLTAECDRIRAPTLLVTGEPALDRVVPVSSTLEYLRLVRGARHVTLEGTGHVGLVSRPDRFAEVIGGFIEEAMPSHARDDSGTGRSARRSARPA